MHVVVKRSGNIGASPEQSKRAAAEVSEVMSYLAKNGGGLTLMPGGGAGGRGREFMAAGMDPVYADTLGRLATLQNGLILSHDLKQARIRHRLLCAPTTHYGDLHGIGDIQTYSAKTLRECHEEGAAGVIVFGTGKNNQSTDTASIEIAQDYHDVFGVKSRVLKAMAHNGVYAEDPGANPRAHRFEKISAQIMEADPNLAAVVDEKCLEAIMNSGIEMQLFNNNLERGGYTLLAALQNPDYIGTIIVPRPGIEIPLRYSAAL